MVRAFVAAIVTVVLGSSIVSASPLLASTYAGSTSTAIFPPPGATSGPDESLFPPGSVVGHPGPTATGEEAEAIATAPALSKLDSYSPLVQSHAADEKPDRSFDVLSHWGPLSPWQSVKSFGLPEASPLIPRGCSLKQVHLLHRHGARYPTGDSSVTKFAASIEYIQLATRSLWGRTHSH